jgi:hypothetical protein
VTGELLSLTGSNPFTQRKLDSGAVFGRVGQAERATIRTALISQTSTGDELLSSQVIAEWMFKQTGVEVGNGRRHTGDDLGRRLSGNDGVARKGLVVLEAGGIETVDSVSERLRFDIAGLPAVIVAGRTVKGALQAGGDMNKAWNWNRAVGGVSCHTGVLSGKADGAGSIWTEGVGQVGVHSPGDEAVGISSHRNNRRG